MATNNEFLKTEEVAEFLGVSYRTFQRHKNYLRAEWGLKPSRRGGRVFYRRSKLVSIIDKAEWKGVPLW